MRFRITGMCLGRFWCPICLLLLLQQLLLLLIFVISPYSADVTWRFRAMFVIWGLNMKFHTYFAAIIRTYIHIKFRIPGSSSPVWNWKVIYIYILHRNYFKNCKYILQVIIWGRSTNVVPTSHLCFRHVLLSSADSYKLQQISMEFKLQIITHSSKL